jgi:tRNA (guanine-N7-)-methyltransferase
MLHVVVQFVRTFSSRTFKPRRRGISASRQMMWADAFDRWGLAEQGPLVDPREVFGRAGELVMEIGSGDGRATGQMAIAEPERDLIAIDVHTPGIARLLEIIEQERLRNLRVVHGDAMTFLGRCPDGMCSRVRVFFPDPWPKRKQQHRRLFAGGRLDEILRVLAPEGTLHVATDIAEYATWLEGLCDAHPDLIGGRIPRDPSRPVTRFEETAVQAGRNIHELLYGLQR